MINVINICHNFTIKYIYEKKNEQDDEQDELTHRGFRSNLQQISLVLHDEKSANNIEKYI